MSRSPIVSRRLLEALADRPLTTREASSAAEATCSTVSGLLHNMTAAGLAEVAAVHRPYGAYTWRITEAGRQELAAEAGRTSHAAEVRRHADRARRAVLQALAQRPEGATSATIAKIAGCSPMQAARSLRTLAQMGLAEYIYPERRRPWRRIAEAGLREAGA